jgi:hypothetical protein
MAGSAPEYSIHAGLVRKKDPSPYPLDAYPILVLSTDGEA